MTSSQKTCSNCKQEKAITEFYGYSKTKDKLQGYCKVCNNKKRMELFKTKRGHLSQYVKRSRMRAKEKNIPHNLTLDYLESIATDCCPVFNTPFDWGLDNKGSGRLRPSLDRIIPELGYVEGNVVFISNWANTIKQDATEKELYAVADWLHKARKKVLNAKEKSTTPLPAKFNQQGQSNSQCWTIPTTGTGQDDNDAHHHCGADARKDTDHRAQESSGDSVGHGGQEVGTFVTSYDIQNNGLPCAENILAEQRRRHLPD